MKNERGLGFVYQPKYSDRQTGEVRRSPTWWISFNVNGKQIRLSSKSTNRNDAVRMLKRKLAEAQAGQPVGIQIDRTMFADLSRILIEHYKTSNLRSLRSTTFRMKRLDAFFANYRARDITADRVTSYVAERLEQKAANATINRELAALKRAFKLAHEAQRVSSVPVIRLLPEENVRQGFIEHADFIVLRDALPERLRDCVTFLYLSGWRVGEMKALEWRDVDPDGHAVRLPPAKSKNKKGRVLPLSGELRSVVDRARQRRRLDCPFVFHREGRPIKDFRTAWNTACKGVGLGKLLVHDLRRTVVRNLVRAGISDKVAMDLTGHKTRSVFDRYDITSERDLIDAVQRVSDYLVERRSERKVVKLG